MALHESSLNLVFAPTPCLTVYDARVANANANRPIFLGAVTMDNTSRCANDALTSVFKQQRKTAQKHR